MLSGLDDALVGKSVIRAIAEGTYEHPEYISIKRNVRSSDRVLEVGAGLGYVTMQCAKIVGPENIITFEAAPRSVELAKTNFRLNGLDVRIEQKVLSGGAGTCAFHVAPNFESSSCVERDGYREVVEVECVDVNEVMAEFQPNFIVLDLEGGEADLVPLMNLDDVDKISIELHPHVIGNYRVSQVIKVLLDKGFSLDLSSSQKKVMFFYKCGG